MKWRPCEPSPHKNRFLSGNGLFVIVPCCNLLTEFVVEAQFCLQILVYLLSIDATVFVCQDISKPNSILECRCRLCIDDAVSFENLNRLLRTVSIVFEFGCCDVFRQVDTRLDCVFEHSLDGTFFRYTRKKRFPVELLLVPSLPVILLNLLEFCRNDC